MSPFSMRCREQRVAAGLVQEHLERIGRIERRADAQVQLQLLLLFGGGAVPFELEREGLCLCIVEIVGDDGVGDVGRGQRPVLATQGQERLKRFGYSRGHADFSQRTPSCLRG
jgi:hypothetical protein